MTWASLYVIGAELPPRRDAPARLVPIATDPEQQLFRIRDTRHGAELEPIDPQSYRDDLARHVAVEILERIPARAGWWLLWLGASGWRYCPPDQALVELDRYAQAALDRAEALLAAGDPAGAFDELDRSVLARPDAPLARAGLIAVAHRLQHDGTWLFEQWLDDPAAVGRGWWLDARSRYPALTSAISSIERLDKRFRLRPSWLALGSRRPPSSFFEREPPVMQ